MHSENVVYLFSYSCLIDGGYYGTLVIFNTSENKRFEMSHHHRHHQPAADGPV